MPTLIRFYITCICQTLGLESIKDSTSSLSHMTIGSFISQEAKASQGSQFLNIVFALRTINAQNKIEDVYDVCLSFPLEEHSQTMSFGAFKIFSHVSFETASLCFFLLLVGTYQMQDFVFHFSVWEKISKLIHFSTAFHLKNDVGQCKLFLEHSAWKKPMQKYPQKLFLVPIFRLRFHLVRLLFPDRLFYRVFFTVSSVRKLFDFKSRYINTWSHCMTARDVLCSCDISGFQEWSSQQSKDQGGAAETGLFSELASESLTGGKLYAVQYSNIYIR